MNPAPRRLYTEVIVVGSFLFLITAQQQQEQLECSRNKPNSVACAAAGVKNAFLDRGSCGI